VMEWEKVPTGAEIEMLVEGAWLNSPTDMATCWPAIWETPNAARHWQAQSTSAQTPIDRLIYRGLGACGRYQRPGARQKWRTARFDLAVVPDPREWLEARLGPLARVEFPSTSVRWIAPGQLRLSEQPLPVHSDPQASCAIPLRDCVRAPFIGGAVLHHGGIQ